MTPAITVTLSEDQIALLTKTLNEIPITGLNLQQLSVATALTLQQAVQASKVPPPAPAPELKVEPVPEGIGMTANGGKGNGKKMAGGQ